MSMDGLIAEVYLESEVEFRREQAAREYRHRAPSQPRRHPRWTPGRRIWGRYHHRRPAVS